MASWQAKLTSAFIRLYFKRQPSGNESEAVIYWRSKMEMPEFLRPHISNDITVERIQEDFIKGEWIRLNSASPNTVYYLHGGGYVAGSPATHRPFTAAIGRRAKTRVFALDYRLAPENRFPAAIEDAVSGYRWLLAEGVKPEQIVIGGDSAGGGLTIATLVSLRDAGLRLPRAAFCISPWTDLQGTGQSLVTNNERDPMFYGNGIAHLGKVYAGNKPLNDPLVSPIYADLGGLPPLKIYVSDSEVLLDDSIRLAERARECGVEVDLHIWENMVHVWPVFVGFGLPEAHKAIEEIAEFIQTQIALESPIPSIASLAETLTC